MTTKMIALNLELPLLAGRFDQHSLPWLPSLPSGPVAPSHLASQPDPGHLYFLSALATQGCSLPSPPSVHRVQLLRQARADRRYLYVRVDPPVLEVRTDLFLLSGQG